MTRAYLVVVKKGERYENPMVIHFWDMAKTEFQCMVMRGDDEEDVIKTVKVICRDYALYEVREKSWVTYGDMTGDPDCPFPMPKEFKDVAIETTKEIVEIYEKITNG